MALTATAHGMEGGNMSRAAKQAFAELAPVVHQAGLMPQVRSALSICPDDPQGPDDPDCRYLAGLLFGYAMADGSGTPEQPALALSGSLAWWPLAPGPYAVFLHRGSYRELHATWAAIYRDWAPTAGRPLRNEAPLELMLNDPSDTAEDALLTEIWIPVEGAL